MPRVIVLILISSLVLVGCRQSAQSTPTPAATLQEDGLDVEMAVDPNPPQVGIATLVITVHGEDGEPVSDAAIAVRGDMSHAGMAPVLADIEGGAEGVYRIPFEWTMGGDWMVTVSIQLSDGRLVERFYEMSVRS